MGLVEVIELRIRPIPEENPAPPKELAEAIWEDLLYLPIWLSIQKTPFASMELYLREEGADGLRKNWWIDSHVIGISFRDHAGSCGASSVAALHWAKLCLARSQQQLQRLAWRFGYQIDWSGPTPEEESEHPEYPLIAIQNEVYYFSPEGLGKKPNDDEEDPILWSDINSLTFSALGEEDKARVQEGRCLCPLCQKARAARATPSLKRLPRSYSCRDSVVLDRAWTVLQSLRNDEDVLREVAPSLRLEELEARIEEIKESDIAPGFATHGMLPPFSLRAPWTQEREEQWAPKLNALYECMERFRSALRDAFPPNAQTYYSWIVYRAEDPRECESLCNVLTNETQTVMLDQHNFCFQVPEENIRRKRLSRLKELQGLWLSDNDFTSLEIDFTLLTELLYLDISANQLTELPPSLRHCKKLIVLCASSNQLRHLPPWLAELPGLEELTLYQNPIPKEEIEALRAKLPGCKITFF